MKKKLLLLLISMCFIACKNNAGSENYLNQPVGIDKNGEYVVTNAETIIQEWETALQKSLDADKIKTLTIVKGITQGDTSEDYYILVARNEKGTAKTAAMLYLEQGKFYFEKQQGPEALSCLTIMCEGNCETGCDPVVKISGDNKYLVCSSCVDCIKTEKEIR